MTPYNHLRSQHCNASWRGQFMYLVRVRVTVFGEKNLEMVTEGDTCTFSNLQVVSFKNETRLRTSHLTKIAPIDLSIPDLDVSD